MAEGEAAMQAWIGLEDCCEWLTKPLRILVALDGSEPSVVALHYIADHIMQNDRDTSIEALHVYNDTKEYLPPALRKGQIQAMTEAKLTSSVAARRWNFTLVQQEGLPAGAHIANVSRTVAADFICLGFYGRKGKKDKHILGSNVTEVLMNTTTSVIVIKDESTEYLPVGRPSRFVVSVSLNQASTKAFLDVLRLSRPGDFIHVVYVKSYLERTESDYTAELRSKYSSLFSGLADGDEEVLHRFEGRTMEFHMITKERRETIAQAVVRFADSVEADFIAVGTNAMRVQRGKTPVGSVSMEICMETDRNFIVAKWLDASRRVREEHGR